MLRIPTIGKRGLVNGVLSGGKLFDYYVDSVNGNDANDGKTPGTAYKTISALAGKITAGKKIGLARGSTWREQLTIGVNNVTVGAYGTGDRPLLDGSDTIAAGAWSKTDGRTNVYQAVITLSLPSADGIVGAWEDNVRLAIVADVATCDSTPGSMVPSAFTGTEITLYIHASASDNPGANGKTYEVTARQFGIFAQSVSGTRLTGVHTRRSTSNASINTGEYSVCTDCRASEGGKHNFYVGGNSRVINCIADEAMYRVGLDATLFVFYKAVGDGTETVYFEGCQAYQTVNYNAAYSGFFGHSGGANMSRCDYVNCTASGIGIGFGGLIDNLYCTDCIADDCSTGYQFQGNTLHITLTNCRVTDGRAGGRAAYFNHAAIQTIVIDGLIAAVATNSNPFIGISAITPAAMTITNSSFTITGPSGTRYAIVCLNSTATIVSNHNTWSGFDYQYEFGAVNPTITSDYNTFNASARWRKNGTIYTSLADWRTGSGQDANSTQA